MMMVRDRIAGGYNAQKLGVIVEVGWSWMEWAVLVDGMV